MKKIFALMLTALLFAACGDDDTDTPPTPPPPPPPPAYFNPVEGQWEDYPNDDISISYRKFTKKFKGYRYMYRNGNLIDKFSMEYTIDSTKIYFPSDIAQYIIDKDTLTLIFPNQTQRYIKTDRVLPD